MTAVERCRQGCPPGLPKPQRKVATATQLAGICSLPGGNPGASDDMHGCGPPRMPLQLFRLLPLLDVYACPQSHAQRLRTAAAWC